MDTKEKLGERLKRLLDGLEKSQNKMAILFGVIPQTLSKYVNNEVKPNSEFLEMVVKETGCNAHWLLTGEGEMYSDTGPQISLSVEDQFIQAYYGENLEEGDDIYIKKILRALKTPFLRIQLNSYLIAAKSDYQKLILNKLPDSIQAVK